MDQRSICLTLLIVCLADGPSSLEVSGPDTLTVGVPYGFRCTALCYPSCSFSWTRGNRTHRGPEYDLLLRDRLPPQVLTCTAVNAVSGKSLSVNKTVLVTGGPSNIRITGPPMLTVGSPSTYVCSADCYPACSFAWTVTFEGIPVGSSKGNTTSVTAPPTADSETLICEATDTVSQLYISTALQVWVARLTDIYITGPSSVEVGGQYTFTCFVTCTPSCTYTWRFNKEVYHGDQIQVPIFHQEGQTVVANKLQISISSPGSLVPLVCEAQNSVSGATISTTKILSVTDSVSVQPVSTGQPVEGKPFSVQCVGSQNPGSVTWLRNGVPLRLSNGTRLSRDNLTLSFSSLLRSNGGQYQCVVSEGGHAITSTGYTLGVIYGPSGVVILHQNKAPVGETMNVLPEATSELLCHSDCYPVCSYSWTYDDKLLSSSSSIAFKPTTPPSEAVLTCTVFNPMTKNTSSAETQVIIVDGPAEVSISGPAYLEVGVSSSFSCVAQCSPPCRYRWQVYGRTMEGSTIHITVSRHVATESISCEAHNTVTGKTATANETLSVTESHWCGC